MGPRQRGPGAVVPLGGGPEFPVRSRSCNVGRDALFTRAFAVLSVGGHVYGWPMDATTPAPPRHALSVLVGRMRTRLGEESGALLWSIPDDELTELLVELQALSGQVESVTF